MTAIGVHLAILRVPVPPRSKGTVLCTGRIGHVTFSARIKAQ
jgi:hypothetical protein